MMNLKIFAASALAASMLAGASYAQTSTSTMQANKKDNVYASEQEKTFMGMKGMNSFFTDDSMTTMKSKEEAKAAFEAMGAEDQAQMKAACDRANQQPGSFGPVSTDLCAAVGVGAS